MLTGRTKRFLLQLFAGGVALAYQLPALAQNGAPAPAARLTLERIISMLTSTAHILLGAGAVVAVGFLVFGGILYMTSGGDKQAVATARRTLTYAIAGLVIILASYVLVNELCETITGDPCFPGRRRF